MTQEWETGPLTCSPAKRAGAAKQSPWYDMATAAVAMIARPTIPQGGKSV